MVLTGFGFYEAEDGRGRGKDMPGEGGPVD
jgi:hypothetical protein